jgi:hypothetical protein
MFMRSMVWQYLITPAVALTFATQWVLAGFCSFVNHLYLGSIRARVPKELAMSVIGNIAI